MTAKDLLKWKVEPPAGAFSSPLQPLLQQLQKQLEAGQFADALRSLHDSFVFLTMLYGGIAVGSLRSVTPLGPDLTLLLDEKPSAEVWARLLRQSWQDWSKHPHHPALEAIRGVFFLGSRLQSSRLGARRHSRWLGLDARLHTNGESFGGWTETIRKAKNINPEAAARQLVMKLPLLNIWLRAGQDFLTNWTLRLDPKQETGEFRYLLNREDCRFDTQPYLSLQQLLLRVELSPQGEFSVSNQLAEAAPVAPAAATPAPTPAKPAETPASKGDVGLQWDPVTKSYRLVGGVSKAEAPANPAPPAPPPAPPVAAKPAETTSKANVAVEWDAASNSYKMVAKPAAPETPATEVKTPPAESKPAAVSSPTPAVAAEPPVAETRPVEPAPAEDIDALLKAEMQSLEEMLAEDPVGELTAATPPSATKPANPFGDLGDMGLDFLMGSGAAAAKPQTPAAAKPKLGPPPILDADSSLDALLAAEESGAVEEPKPEPSLEELLDEEPKPEPSLEDLLEEEPKPEPSLEDLLDEEPKAEPSLEDLLDEEPKAEPSLEDLLDEEPEQVKPASQEQPGPAAVVKGPGSLGPPPPLEDEFVAPTPVVEATPSLDELLADEPPAPVAPPVVEAAPSLDELLADEPTAPVVPPVVEAAPSLDELLADEPPAPVAPPVVEAAPSLDELLSDEPPAPVAPPVVEAAPSLDELLADEPPAPVAPPVVEAAPSLDELLADEPPAPVAPPVVEAAPSLDELLADEPPAPVIPPVVDAAPSLDELLADEPPAAVAPPAVEAAPSLDELLADEPPAPVAPPVVEAAPSLDELLADEPPVPVAPPVVESAPSLDELLADEPPAPVVPPVVEAAPSLDELLADEPPIPVAPPVVDSAPSLDELLADEPPIPVAPPVVDSAPSLDELLADEPPIPVAPPVVDSAPSLDELLADEPPAPVVPPVVEAAPSLDELLADEPAPVVPTLTIPDEPQESILQESVAEVEPIVPSLVVEPTPVSEALPATQEEDSPTLESLLGLDPVTPPVLPPPAPVTADVAAPTPVAVVPNLDFPVPPPPSGEDNWFESLASDPVAPPSVPVDFESLFASEPSSIEATVEPVVPTPPPVVEEVPVELVAPPVIEAVVEPEIPTPPPVVQEVPVEPVAPPVIEAVVEPEIPTPPPVVQEIPVELVAPPVIEAVVEPEIPTPPPVIREIPVEPVAPPVIEAVVEPEAPTPPPVVEEVPVELVAPPVIEAVVEPEVPTPPPAIEEIPVEPVVPPVVEAIVEPEIPTPPPVVEEVPVELVAPPVIEAIAEPEIPTPPPVVQEVPVEPVAPPVIEAVVEPEIPTPPPVVQEIPVELVAPPVVEAIAEPEIPIPPPVVQEIPVEPVAPPVIEAVVEPEISTPPPVVQEIPVEPVAPPVVEAIVEPEIPTPPPVVQEIPVEPVAPPVVEAVIEPVAPTPPAIAEATVEPVFPPMVEIGSADATATAASVLVPHLPAEETLTVIPVEEEIEEYDTYQFDPNSGPPAPPWQAWNSADRAALDEVTQALQERMAHFDFSYLTEQIRGFINKGRSGYLIIEGESGVGKSYLGSYLESTAPQVHPRGIRIAYLKAARRPYGDYEVFIETLNDQIQASNAPRTHRIQPLDRLALQDLAVQYPSDKKQGRFAAFTTLLTVQNRGPVLLFLDEIDRRYQEDGISPTDFLPLQLPDNVYVVITHRSDASEGFLNKLKALTATRFTLEPVAAEYRKQLDADLSHIVQAQPTRAAIMLSNEYRLHYTRLAAQAVANGMSDAQTKYAELYASLTRDLRAQRPERFHAIQHFLMTLCAAFEPMSWDDIDQWGSSVETVREIVDLAPALLLQQKLGMFLTVDIAHESLRDFLINQNQEAFQDVCRILCGWTVHSLQQAGELKLQSEQGREWARANFYRLYRWSLLSRDMTTLEWVVRNKDLQKKRIAVSQALESSARPHQKLGLLDLWVECLRELTEEHERADLRDELAWALNSRGLTYLNLHRRQRALSDLDRSVELFETLVNQERQTQFRNGLAAAYNRRSEIHFALQDYDQALKDSTESVRLFTDLVEDMGREDLQPLLAYAHRNQSSVWAAKHNLDEANRSMEAAIKLFVKLSQGADETRYTKDQASCHLQLAQQRQRARQHQESLSESGKAVAMLSQLSEKDAGLDIRAILERAHFARGLSYLATDQADKAQRDFTKSITLSTQLIDEGRLDHRDELAEAFSQRGKTQLDLKQPKEGLRDFSKAIELRQKLVAEGRSDQTLGLAQEFIQRAEVYRVDKQEEACQSDLAAALNLLRNESGEVTSLLLQVHRQKAALGLQLGRYADVVEDADQALKLLKSTLSGDPEQEAQLFSLRGESNRRLLHSEKARQDFESAVSIFTDLLQSKGGSTYLLGLAEAYGDLARVSLTTGHLDRAQEEVNRSVEALEVASKDNQDCRALLAQAYSTRAEVLERQGQHATARQELQKTLGLYSKLVEAEGQAHLLDEQALAYRRLGRTLLSLNESNPARDALEQATRRYKELWSKDRKGPWLDEISRTQVVNSAVSVTLKEYGAAEEEIQRSQEHFSGLLDQGKVEYFNDVLQTSMQRSRNFVRVGMHAKAGDELTRMLELLKRTAAQFEQVDFREAQARVLQAKAGVSSSLQQFEQAYNDFETAIQTLQPLVVEESQFHLGRDLADMYRQRAKMLTGAGHVQPGIADLSQAAQVLSILLQQGRDELRLPLAQVAQERAAAYLSQSELVAGVEDLNLGIELLMSMAGGNDSEIFAMLAQMLAQRGRCFQQAQQLELASADFEKAVQLYSRLVEQQGRQDLSAVLAECLLSHLSLSGQGVEDPARLQALVKAVRLVTQQTKDSKPAEESFVVDAVTAVRNSLVQRPDQANSELVDSVLKLSEAILQVPRINYNWVGLTQLLSECYGALETYKGPKYVSFICLSCVSCGREVGSVGAASLPRLIYFLTLLGITLGSERPGEQLGLVGNAFTNLLEQLARQRLDESQALSLRQLVTTWQQLPAGYPAAANVSRGVLTNLLRAT